jgi:hypothetical protein
VAQASRLSIFEKKMMQKQTSLTQFQKLPRQNWLRTDKMPVPLGIMNFSENQDFEQRANALAVLECGGRDTAFKSAGVFAFQKRRRASLAAAVQDAAAQTALLFV